MNEHTIIGVAPQRSTGPALARASAYRVMATHPRGIFLSKPMARAEAEAVARQWVYQGRTNPEIVPA